MIELNAPEVWTWRYWETRWNAKAASEPEKLGLLHWLPKLLEVQLLPDQAWFLCHLLASAHARTDKRKYWDQGVWVLKWLVRDRLSRMIHRDDFGGHLEFVNQLSFLPDWTRSNYGGLDIGGELRLDLASLLEKFASSQGWLALRWAERDTEARLNVRKLGQALLALEAFDKIIQWQLFEAIPMFELVATLNGKSTVEHGLSVHRPAAQFLFMLQAAFDCVSGA